MDIQSEMKARGTRIVVGKEAEIRRDVIGKLVKRARDIGFAEIVLPTIEPSQVYTDKAGAEILGQMYVFKDQGDRDLCLRPEGTATCQILAQSYWKSTRDLRLFYEARCFRYERPQAGRYREFTQFGVEILNPRKDCREELIALADMMMIDIGITEYELNGRAQRGLAYYVGDGFEISVPKLGAQKQVLGGGSYAEGIGFAFGVDRLVMAIVGE